jgi:hypothetical protein
VVEAQRAIAAAEARPEAEVQPAATFVAALPAASAVEGHPTPAAAETQPEVVVEARPEPALAGSSQKMAVEIPDDDAPPPGWDQWVNLPMPSPEP